MPKYMFIKQVNTEKQKAIFNVNIQTLAKRMKLRFPGEEGSKNIFPECFFTSNSDRKKSNTNEKVTSMFKRQKNELSK